VKNNKVRGKIDKIPIAFADAILVALEITPSNREVKVSKVRALVSTPSRRSFTSLVFSLRKSILRSEIFISSEGRINSSLD
jgi:hypothetical protein